MSHSQVINDLAKISARVPIPILFSVSQNQQHPKNLRNPLLLSFNCEGYSEWKIHWSLIPLYLQLLKQMMEIAILPINWLKKMVILSSLKHWLEKATFISGYISWGRQKRLRNTLQNVQLKTPVEKSLHILAQCTLLINAVMTLLLQDHYYRLVLML